MPRRIEIELTSRTDDGSFTWRAAGAKQPRGVVGAGLLPAGSGVGDVVRAEIESGLDGLEVVAVLARPEKSEEPAQNRIEVLGTPHRGPDVSITYAPGARRRRDDGERGDRPAARRARPAGPGRERAERPHEPRRAERGPRRERREPQGEGAREPARRAETADRRPPRPERPDVAAARRERRPAVPTAHRNALLATLGPEQLPIAEQLLRGGIPAVRQALAEQAARQGGATAANSDAVLAIAEQLLPRVNLATWKDRAAGAATAGKELRLRELRAVVAASRTVVLDDEARAIARSLRESLDERVRALREEWLARLGKALGDGRVTDAVRLSSRPPEPGTRLPAELAVSLADAAGSGMTAELDPHEWTALLEAVVDSPVRRNVKPQGIPEGAVDAARRAAGSVPELARLLGLPIPPPPPPRRPPVRVMAGGGGARAAGR